MKPYLTLVTNQSTPQIEPVSEPFIQTLAYSTMNVLQIPEGNGLVGVVGSGFEHTNAEAVAHWIRNYYETTGAGDTSIDFEALCARLNQVLIDWETGAANDVLAFRP